MAVMNSCFKTTQENPGKDSSIVAPPHSLLLMFFVLLAGFFPALMRFLGGMSKFFGARGRRLFLVL
jgi:hypothetical protein